MQVYDWIRLVDQHTQNGPEKQKKEIPAWTRREPVSTCWQILLTADVFFDRAMWSRRSWTMSGALHHPHRALFLAMIVALSMNARVDAQASVSPITQRELRGIFLHHQEYCRETAVRVGAGGVERKHWVSHSRKACEASGAHEWFVDENAIAEEGAFQEEVREKVSAYLSFL